MGLFSDKSTVDLDSTEAYTYDLPDELLAAYPTERRDESRLLVIQRHHNLDTEPPPPEDRVFRDLVDILRPGDLLVLNETRVIPARLYGSRVPGGGKIELLLLEKAEQAENGSSPNPKVRYRCLARPAKRLHPGNQVQLPDGRHATVIEECPGGERILEFPNDLDAILQNHGEIPLPPYILQRRKSLHPELRSNPTRFEDCERYQTVYASKPGSVAAPTAGLHFTLELLQQLQQNGIESATLELHVGIGTFRPMDAARVSDHKLHSESGFISQATIDKIEKTRSEGGRVIAVGTTSCRALEGVAALNQGKLVSGPFETSLFIRQGFEFQIIDGLITNFHLPGSTLLVLVGTFAGYPAIQQAYAHAVAQKYRFYSYGDAMIILPPGDR